MKVFSTRTLFLALIVVASGCGKDNKSGGSGSQPNPQPSPISGNFGSGSAQENFKSWYFSTTEGPIPGVGSKTERRTIKTYSQTDGCELKPINIFGIDLGSFNYCFSGSSQSSIETVTRTVNVTPSFNKSSNTVLAGVYSGSDMTLVKLTEDKSFYGKVFFFEYAKPNGHRVLYKVDTGIHSAFNPIEISDSEEKTLETVTTIQ
jgi:hypothetical protein